MLALTRVLAVMLPSAILPPGAAAQATSPRDSATTSNPPVPLRVEKPDAPVIVGSPLDERRRLADLLGTGRSAGLLLRAPSTSDFARDTALGPEFGYGVRARAVLPSVRVSWNSALPFSLNDGVLWAGRGASVLVRGGLLAERGPVRLVLLPEVTVSQNRPFAFRPQPMPEYSPFASPWYAGSADVPTRFGNRRWRLASFGQSSLTWTYRSAAFGAATENAWWGPGVRNALLLSNNAEGFPHLFARTARPLRTPLGLVEARYLLGALTASLYYDSADARRWRSFNAVAVTLQPAPAPHLTLGVARTVVARAGRSRSGSLGHAVDVLTVWSSDSARGSSGDQLLGAFARYVLPDDHVEVYAEWARQVAPGRLREVLVAPQDGQGYTLGAQLGRPVSGGRRVARVQLELTNLEQSRAFTDRPPRPALYTGVATLEGYTHRGQVLGAAIGPSGQSQWAAVDLLGRRAQGGLFAGRIRHNNDALYAQPNANFVRHDVTTFLGARGGLRTPVAELAAEVYLARRYNYEFRNAFGSPSDRTVDVTNLTLGFGVTPR